MHYLRSIVGPGRAWVSWRASPLGGGPCSSINAVNRFESFFYYSALGVFVLALLFRP